MPDYTRFMEKVEQDLNSESDVAQAYAIRACCVKGFSSPTIISALKRLKNSSTRAMWQNISDAATAALHLIGAERYSGNNPAIIEIIRTKDYSIHT